MAFLCFVFSTDKATNERFRFSASVDKPEPPGAYLYVVNHHVNDNCTTIARVADRSMKLRQHVDNHFQSWLLESCRRASDVRQRSIVGRASVCQEALVREIDYRRWTQEKLRGKLCGNLKHWSRREPKKNCCVRFAIVKHFLAGLLQQRNATQRVDQPSKLLSRTMGY